MTNLLGFTGTCQARITSQNSAGVIPILDIPIILAQYRELEADYFLAFDIRLESLRAEISLLSSLQKAPFPNIYPEDSTSVKLEKKFAIEQDYPVIGLEILKETEPHGLLRLSEILLQNKGSPLHAELRLPYLGTGAVKLLGASDRLSLRLKDRGFGLIASENDYIQVEGDYSVIISGVQRIDPSIQKVLKPGAYSAPQVVPVTDVVTLLCPESSNYKYLSIHNQGPSSVLLRVGGDASLDSYNVVIPANSNLWDFRVGSQKMTAIVESGGSPTTLMVAVASEIIL